MSTLITTTAQIGTIKDAGGNATAMTIDSTGRVLQPAKPAFHIRCQSVNNVDFSSGVTLAGSTYLQSATLEEQGGSNFNVSTGQYVAPLTGFYYFHFGGRFDNFASATVSNDNIVQSMVGGNTKDQAMPRFLGDIMASLLSSIGPKGVNFARYSIDYHVLRNYLHVLNEWGDEAANKMLPDYADAIIKHYLDTDTGFKKMVQVITSKQT